MYELIGTTQKRNLHITSRYGVCISKFERDGVMKRRWAIAMLLFCILWTAIPINVEAASKEVSKEAVEKSFVETALEKNGSGRFSGIPSSGSWCGYFVAWAMKNSVLGTEISNMGDSITISSMGESCDPLMWAARKGYGTIYITPGSQAKHNTDFYYNRFVKGFKDNDPVPSSNVVIDAKFIPQPGDIVLYDWIWDVDGDFDHTGIMTSQTGTIEGNTNGGIVAKRSLTEIVYDTNGNSHGKRGEHVCAYFRFNTEETYNIEFYKNYSEKNYLMNSDFSSLDSENWKSRDTSVATIAVDSSQRYPQEDGYNSLRIDNKSAGASGKDLVFRTTTQGSKDNTGFVGDDKSMVLSFWAKASQNGTQMYFRWGYESASVARSVKLTTDWKQYTVRMDKKPLYGSDMHAYADRAGSVWLCQVQLEDGTTPTSFLQEVGGQYKKLTAVYGKNYSLPAEPTRSGFQFLGWYTSASGSEEISSTTAVKPGHYKVYAQWAPTEPYNISVSKKDVTLVLGEHDSETITVSWSGSFYGRYRISLEQDNSNVSWTFGETASSQRSAPLIITANQEGQTRIILSLIDKNANKTLSVCYLDVTVKHKEPVLESASVTDRGIVVRWKASPGASWYAVYRKVNGSDWQYVGSTMSLLLVDQDIVYGNTYTYTVACNANNYNSSDYNTTGVSAVCNLSHTISYHANGGERVPENQTKYYGIDLKLSSQSAVRTGYSFKGWAASPDGEVIYQPGDLYRGNSSTVLYAIWEPTSLIITFNWNGGESGPYSQMKVYDQDTWITMQKPVRTGYSFKGWAISVDGEVVYWPGDLYTSNDGIILYAVWEQIPVVEEMSSGICGAEGDGSNLTWTLNTDGVLTINGTGSMKNYSTNKMDRPWDSLRNGIVRVVILDGVTNIGNASFFYCGRLSHITIPDSVTEIGDDAFNGCIGLSSVDIPDSVKSIGTSVFSYCNSLRSVDLPDSVISIGNYLFSHCNSLSSVVIPDSVKSIGHCAFYECTNLSSVVIGSGVTTMGREVFYGCTNLKSIDIPDNVTTVGTSLFRECTSLSSVGIGNGLSGINDEMFYNCSSLSNVDLPDNMIGIGDKAFFNCSSLSSVDIPDSVTSIGDKAFYNCYDLTSANLPDSVSSIGKWAFYHCRNLNYMDIPDGVTAIGFGTFQGCTGLKDIVIPDHVTVIGNQAFYDCTGLERVYISNSVTTIDNNAFRRCISLSNVDIPDGVTSIGNWAFKDCTNLSSVTLPNSLTSIGDKAFEQCSKLFSICFAGTNSQWNNIQIGADAISQEIKIICIGIMQASWNNNKVSAEVYCAQKDETLYCAAYDSTGKLLETAEQSLTAGSNQVQFTLTKGTNAASMKLFVLNKNLIPVCSSYSVSKSA